MRSYNRHHGNTKDHKRLHEQSHANKMDNLLETDKFLEIYVSQKLNQEEI